MARFADVRYSNTFIKKVTAQRKLGVRPDDTEAAVGASILLSPEISDKDRNCRYERGTA